MTSHQIAAIAIVALVGVAAVGGGLTYAAKNAEPGDTLYPLRASVYGDVTADAGVQTNLTAARDAYDEAEDLERQGMLTASERARLTASYSLHVNAILRRIAELEADGDAEAALALRTSLRSALREFHDVFPNFENGNSSASAASSSTGSEDNETENENSSANSSIFMQPSSPMTSA